MDSIYYIVFDKFYRSTGDIALRTFKSRIYYDRVSFFHMVTFISHYGFKIANSFVSFCFTNIYNTSSRTFCEISGQKTMNLDFYGLWKFLTSIIFPLKHRRRALWMLINIFPNQYIVYQCSFINLFPIRMYSTVERMLLTMNMLPIITKNLVFKPLKKTKSN